MPSQKIMLDRYFDLACSGRRLEELNGIARSGSSRMYIDHDDESQRFAQIESFPAPRLSDKAHLRKIELSLNFHMFCPVRTFVR
jgi:hypothetical protein